MITFTLPLFSLLLLFSAVTTTAQPYNATDYFLINCGSSSTATSDRRWGSDSVPSNITTTFSSAPNFRDPSVPEIPYSTARIFNTSSYTYTFPVTQGPKFLRLYFYPATYSDLNANQSFFSVSSNGYSLLSNFSAFLTASYVGATLSDAGLGSPPVPHLVKEFIVSVNNTQTLNITFTPSANSYAFINGIEIVSLPENLYYVEDKVKYVGQNSGPVINQYIALENIYRLNVGGSQISLNDDTGMYRSWDQDDRFVFPASAIGVTPVYQSPITYTIETPNYTAPELVYQTQRSMGKQSERYNLTWLLPVDSGFYYKLRLHFCNIIPEYTRRGEVVFRIFINNQTAEEEADLFFWTEGSGYPVYKDYVVFVNDEDGSRSKQDLWVAMSSNPDAAEEYADAYLNGLEVFKISMDRNLAGPNPELGPTPQLPRPASPVNDKKSAPPYAAIIGGGGGGLFLFSALALIVFRRRRVKTFCGAHKSFLCPNFKKSCDLESAPPPPPSPPQAALPAGRCRRFSLKQVKDATSDFSEDRVIGKGGFGKVYKGYIDNATNMVAIKRLNSTSKQGFHEFETEIGLLSKLRHVQLVSLIGFCYDEGEMVLVYDYMTHGTLREHLYKTNNPHLSWKTRLNICIGAAKGLHYLHKGASHTIIHRDVKSTNILLDEKWEAKMSDFGLSRLGPTDKTQNHVTTLVKGTIGYMDPEYYRMQKLTDKSDVYSFGVVLLEVLCARPVISHGTPDEEVNLAEWGRTHYRKGTLHEIIDPKIRGEIAPNCLMKFGEVANNCLKMKGSKRPSMEDVVWGLEFALQLQVAATQTSETVGKFDLVLEKPDHIFSVQEDTTIMTTTTEEYESGLSGETIQYSISSTNISSQFQSETILTSPR